MPTATATTTGTTTHSSRSSLGDRLRSAAISWARSQHELVVLAVEFAVTGEWVLDGSPTAAHWIADVADIEVCTAREWIRIGRRLFDLPATADAFATGSLSYAKVRVLTRIAEPDNDAELVAIATDVPAEDLSRALAAWVGRNSDPDDLAAHQQRQRSITSRVEPDGMTVYTCRLPPLTAGRFSALLDTTVMGRRPSAERGQGASADAWPSLAQQRADALDIGLIEGTGGIDTEIVVHVRGDGCALDDGTPIPDTVVADLAPGSFLRALIHDAEGRPINASARRRHPTTRQKRVVRERDRTCRDCGTTHFLEYDHNPSYQLTHRTIITELELRYSACHRRRHRQGHLSC